MTSSLALIAYVLRTAEPGQVTARRLAHAGEHLQPLGFSAAPRLDVRDEASGMVAWSHPSQLSTGLQLVQGDAEGIAWLHRTGSVADPIRNTNPGDRFKRLMDGTADLGTLTPPFAALRWARGRLEIVNDILGLARLFHFSFPDVEVWATRAGLAHIFAGSPPRANQRAWAGMATIGWAPGGVTQLGEGRQVPAASIVRAERVLDGTVSVREESRFAEWFGRARAEPVPSTARMVDDMRHAMEAATLWPERPVADLSGGRDSRLIAAVGISNGTVQTVRTVRSDHGEVETAQRLVSLLNRSVKHVVVEAAVPPQGEQGVVRERILSHHAAWEGRYLASAGILGRSFRGFRPRASAAFNGLGGEVLAGGALWPGSWKPKLLGSDATAAKDRIAAMAAAQAGTAGSAREQAVSQLAEYVELAQALGVPSGGAVMDLIYMRDRMPNWVNTFTTVDVLCPLFAPSLMVQAVHSVGNPIRDGALHEKMIAEAVPEWEGVAFYKPSGHARLARPRVWEQGFWREAFAIFTSGVERSANFNSTAVDIVQRQVADATAAKNVENLIYRVLWESAFDDYVAVVAAAARRCAHDVSVELQKTRESSARP